MDFRAKPHLTPPKNLYPCLATITVGPASERNRRLSSGSQGEDDNALRRVISGGRRKTSFGEAADRGSGDDKRRNIQSMAGEDVNGKWYWRVQAGATDSHLVLLPLSQPPNSLLTVAPQPLSQAMPSHSASAAKAKTSHPGGVGGHGSPSHPGTSGQSGGDEGSLTSKFKNLFKKSSSNNVGGGAGSEAGANISAADQVADENNATQSATRSGHGHEGSDAMSDSPSTTTTAVDDKILDQNARGQQMPSAEANRIGATNLNSNAETDWPGFIKGEKLGCVSVDLRSVDKSKIVLGGGKKNEGSWVTVPITAGAGLESVGRSLSETPKSGTIRFDFDKDWIGAKGEAELLHHYIMASVENLPSGTRHQPQQTNLQLGQHSDRAAASNTAASTAFTGGAVGTATSPATAQGATTTTGTTTGTGIAEPAAENVALGKEVPTS